MTVCPKCDGLMERRTFDAPEDYREFVRLLIENVNQGNLVLMRADWLRQQGPEGYQSRLNALLRSVMLRDLESKRKRA